MEVIDARRTRSYRMKSYARGQDDAAVLYLEPAREKGTKMLRKDDNLWLDMPRAPTRTCGRRPLESDLHP